jgi:hypothetical protein
MAADDLPLSSVAFFVASTVVMGTVVASYIVKKKQDRVGVLSGDGKEFADPLAGNEAQLTAELVKTTASSSSSAVSDKHTAAFFQALAMDKADARQFVLVLGSDSDPAPKWWTRVADSTKPKPGLLSMGATSLVTSVGDLGTKAGQGVSGIKDRVLGMLKKDETAAPEGQQDGLKNTAADAVGTVTADGTPGQMIKKDETVATEGQQPPAQVPIVTSGASTAQIGTSTAQIADTPKANAFARMKNGMKKGFTSMFSKTEPSLADKLTKMTNEQYDVAFANIDMIPGLSDVDKENMRVLYEKARGVVEHSATPFNGNDAKVANANPANADPVNRHAKLGGGMHPGTKADVAFANRVKHVIEWQARY